jgi:hypothetical protein
MKKILTFLILFFSVSSVFSQTIKFNKTAKLIPWHLISAAEYYGFQNTQDSLLVRVSVSPIIMRDGHEVRADQVKVTCGKTKSDLPPGGQTTCLLLAKEIVQVEIENNQFKNGSEGSFTIID